MRISDWSSDVCSSDLLVFRQRQQAVADPFALFVVLASVALVEAANVAADLFKHRIVPRTVRAAFDILTSTKRIAGDVLAGESAIDFRRCLLIAERRQPAFLGGDLELAHDVRHAMPLGGIRTRSEEHTSELQ